MKTFCIKETKILDDLFLFSFASAGDNQLSEVKEKDNNWDRSKVKDLSRKFNIDLAPKVSVLNLINVFPLL